ncbi:MAG: hypothetical protein LBJ23_00190 [Tannerella sp.]|jgi:tRNA A37 threonylcarbamoyladenosine modification protein TsaB|nr:hypothetical protein [Tannerella sp.]
MLTAGISTSSGQFTLIIGENGKVLFDSSEHAGNNELDDSLRTGLEYCKRKINEITNIIVDTGPGGTSRVRTGIAFANSLSYGLGISVCPVSSMELAGIEAWSKYGVPVINSVKSIKGNAYIGLYNKYKLISIKYGEVHDIVPLMVKNINKFVVTGYCCEAIVNLPSIKDKIIIGSSMPYGNAKFLVEKESLFISRKLTFPEIALPITEKTL